MQKKNPPNSIDIWTFDQLAKSTFFHRKLHEWNLLDIVDQIDKHQGENLSWEHFGISSQAWNKIIHRGIKPILVFAHPTILRNVLGSAGYYRMLAMVSQKSMKRIGINLDGFETGRPIRSDEVALKIANHLNKIISALIEADEQIDAREFDLWRGMAAGAQAQGSWQNTKGALAEKAIREIILQRLIAKNLISKDSANAKSIELSDNKILVFSNEPDIALYQNGIPKVAVEIKGGIDSAGVLERIGAAIKSLQRVRQVNPNSITVLIMQDISVTSRAKEDLNISLETVTYMFSAKAILESGVEREEFFKILGI